MPHPTYWHLVPDFLFPTNRGACRRHHSRREAHIGREAPTSSKPSSYCAWVGSNWWCRRSLSTASLMGIPSQRLCCATCKQQIGLVLVKCLISILTSLIRMCFVCLCGFLTFSSAARLYRRWSENSMCCHTETELGNHDFSLRWSHYTDTDPTSRERVPGAGIKLKTSSEMPTPHDKVYWIFRNTPRPSIKQQNTKTSTAPEMTAVIKK